MTGVLLGFLEGVIFSLRGSLGVDIGLRSYIYFAKPPFGEKSCKCHFLHK